MQGPTKEDGPSGASGEVVVVSRSFPGDLQAVWDRWTTPSGLQSWWGPEDCITRVRRVEARPGGAVEIDYEYAPAAASPARAREFEQAGIPIRFTARGTFTTFEPRVRLDLEQRVDYGPGSPPQSLSLRVDLKASHGTIDLRVAARASASAHWRVLGRANLERQVDRLVASLRAGAGRRP